MTQSSKANHRMSGFLPCTEEADSSGVGVLKLEPDPLTEGEIESPALMRKQIDTLQKNLAAIHSHLETLESAGIFAKVH